MVSLLKKDGEVVAPPKGKPKSGWGMKDNNLGGAVAIKKGNIWDDKV